MYKMSTAFRQQELWSRLIAIRHSLDERMIVLFKHHLVCPLIFIHPFFEPFEQLNFSWIPLLSLASLRKSSKENANVPSFDPWLEARYSNDLLFSC